jgi:hypothetical protein
MNQHEHPARKPSPGPGLFAVPRAFYHSNRSGASSLRVVTVCALVLLALLASATSALAGAPKFNPFPNGRSDVEEIHSTRATVETEINPEGLETKWRSEYATNQAGPYTPSDSGAGDEGPEAFIGSLEGWYAGGIGAVRVLRHLIPETKYYVRFVAENEAGQTTESVVFTTLPVARPEIAHHLDLDLDLNENKRVGASSSFSALPTSGTSVEAKGDVESNGATTSYSFAYSTSLQSGQWTTFGSGGSGSISVGEDIGQLSASTTGLKPETLYYIRLQATNSKGTTEEVTSTETGTLRPRIGETSVFDVRGSSVRLSGRVTPHGSATGWRFEYAPSAIGPWSPVPGASGTVSQAEAEALPYEYDVEVSGALGGLSRSTTYYVRLFAENEAGEGVSCYEKGCEPISTSTSPHVNIEFQTEGPPSVGTFATHALHGEAIRLLGSVNPNETPTSEVQTVMLEGAPTGGTFTLSFDGHTTEPIAFDAPAQESVGKGSVEGLLTNAIGNRELLVSGPEGGPYTVQFAGKLAGSSQPPIVADGSGLTPSGSVVVAVAEQGGETADIHYHFEYEGQKQFEEAGGTQPFAQASSTPEVDLSESGRSTIIGQDLPGLVPGESYRYRLVATSTLLGSQAIDGEEQSLTVADPTIEPQPGCANEALRSGPSAHLPDCRAYEQVTPGDKEGAKELLNYGGSTGEGILAGVDGDHVVVGEPETAWGAGPKAGVSPYFFSRNPRQGWVMTAGTPQPEAGIDRYAPQVFSSDLTAVGLASEWNTSAGAKSEDIEFKAGPSGGPYVTFASVPRAEVAAAPGGGLVAASESLSTVILEVPDHVLLSPTGTKSGSDLYEYSAGELRQVNVETSGATIGTCGARIVHGLENVGVISSSHAVSADGSRVFFEAVSGSRCGEPTDLYMRANGQTTTLIGAYRFLATNASGSEVLLESSAGDVSRYDTETSSVEPLTYDGSDPVSLAGITTESGLTVAEDLGAITFATGKLDAEAPGVENGKTDLYRYDLQTRALRFIAQVSLASGGLSGASVSPDGRDLYFESSEVAGVPAGGEELSPKSGLGSANDQQAFRYDATEGVLQCISCASSFDPAPRLGANYIEEGVMRSLNQGAPAPRIASANGDYVFFQTAAALLPSDVDGEVEPEGAFAGDPVAGSPKPEHQSATTSVSSDVYEWTREGIHGCYHAQGCLSLITSGKGGFINTLLGTDTSGEDVFFYTNESLLPRDNDTAGDIYDARVNGGFPEPVQGVECEGDACSTPPSAPNDATPSSSTFNGAGNLTPPAAVVGPGVAKKGVKCAKGKKLSRGRCVKPKKKKRKAKKAADGSSDDRRSK